MLFQALVEAKGVGRRAWGCPPTKELRVPEGRRTQPGAWIPDGSLSSLTSFSSDRPEAQDYTQGSRWYILQREIYIPSQPDHKKALLNRDTVIEKRLWTQWGEEGESRME